MARVERRMAPRVGARAAQPGVVEVRLLLRQALRRLLAVEEDEAHGRRARGRPERPGRARLDYDRGPRGAVVGAHEPFGLGQACRSGPRAHDRRLRAGQSPTMLRSRGSPGSSRSARRGAARAAAGPAGAAAGPRRPLPVVEPAPRVSRSALCASKRLIRGLRALRGARAPRRPHDHRDGERRRGEQREPSRWRSPSRAAVRSARGRCRGSSGRVHSGPRGARSRAGSGGPPTGGEPRRGPS